MLAILFLSFCLCVKGHPFIKRPSQCPQFTYDDNDFKFGPSVWGSLCDADYMCGVGKSQSPINLEMAHLKPDPRRVGVNLNARNGTIFYNNGLHPEQADGLGFPASLLFTSPENSVFGGPLPDQNYQFLRFHFHAESEHTIDGKRYPLEMHLVVSDSSKKLAVLGFLFEVSDSNPFLENLVNLIQKYSYLPEISSFSVGEIKLEELTRDVTDYVSYSGSLSTPPCTEDVTWLISSKVLKASQAQIDIIAANTPLSRNYRPIQPLNSRTLTIHPSAGTFSTQQETPGKPTSNSARGHNSIYAIVASLVLLAISSLAAVKSNKI